MGAGGRVVALRLGDNGLAGSLAEAAPHICRLARLEELWLGGNALTGPLPPELARTPPRLRKLDVSRNALVGVLPPAFTVGLARRRRRGRGGSSVPGIGGGNHDDAEKVVLEEEEEEEEEEKRAFSRFTWLDTSGNDLTAFYTATAEMHTVPATSTTHYADRTTSHASEPPQKCTKATAPTAHHKNDTIHAPTLPQLASVHLTSGVLSTAECASLRNMAEGHAARGGGWQTDRHHMYKTTDIDVRDSVPMLTFCNDALERAVLPALASCFGVRAHDLEMDDLFVAKYQCPDAAAAAAAAAAATTAASETCDSNNGQDHLLYQVALAPHRDDSVVSFVVPLNRMGRDFDGGGTEFVDWTPAPFVAAPELEGTMVSFCGLQRHAGRRITRGTRYILAGFVRCPKLRQAGESLFPR